MDAMNRLPRVPLTSDAVEWLKALAREPGYVSANEVAPCECFRPLLWIGFVEQDHVSFRISNLGRWALTMGVVEDVGD